MVGGATRGISSQKAWVLALTLPPPVNCSDGALSVFGRNKVTRGSGGALSTSQSWPTCLFLKQF